MGVGAGGLGTIPWRGEEWTSDTGIGQGNPFGVPGGVAVGFYWTAKMEEEHPDTWTGVYIDDTEYTNEDPYETNRAAETSGHVYASLDLETDAGPDGKAFTWALTKEDRKVVGKAQSQGKFIIRKTRARMLGAQLNFSNKIEVGCVGVRIREEVLRLRRLQLLPYSRAKKNYVIQVGCHSSGKHGVEAVRVPKAVECADRNCTGHADQRRLRKDAPSGGSGTQLALPVQCGLPLRDPLGPGDLRAPLPGGPDRRDPEDPTDPRGAAAGSEVGEILWRARLAGQGPAVRGDGVGPRPEHHAQPRPALRDRCNLDHEKSAVVKNCILYIIKYKYKCTAQQ